MSSKTPNYPTWNLSDLYKSESDPAIAATLTKLDKSAVNFKKKYSSQILKLSASPQKILKLLQEFEILQIELTKPGLFASLRFAETSEDPGRGAFLQKIRAKQVEISQDFIFLELELIKLGAKKLALLSKHPSLKNYANYFKQLAEREAHILTESEESLIDKLYLTGRGAFVRLFNEEHGAKMYELKHGGKSEKLSATKILELLYAPKRDLRKAAAECFTKGLIEESRRTSYIFNILIEAKATEDKLRKFPTPQTSRHLANQIDQSMVDALTSAVTGSYSLVHKYYNLKRKILKLDKLYEYDRYAPLPNLKQENIPYEESKKLILNSFSSFSPNFTKIVSEFFDRKWIDAQVRKGKRGGAFCSGGTPDMHPYVLVNYAPHYKETFTLAHELGHAVHFSLMRRNSYLNFDTPLTIAETASIFAEMLLFSNIKAKIKNKQELLSLLCNRIEGIIGATFRQVSMYLFECDFHAQRNKGTELRVSEINAIWRAQQVKMYGKSVTLNSNYDYWWSYIPHFIHTPFYVYAYAFGELLTLSLYNIYKKQGKSFVPTYTEFLASGGTRSPQELVSMFGLNLADKNFWGNGLGVLGELIEEAEGLV